MKLFKLMATTAITTMAVAAMSVSASAMTATYTAPVGDAAGSVTLSDIATTAEQKTLLILNKDAENVVEGDIVQIDQDATLTSVAVGDLAAAIDAANQTALEAYEAGEKNADTYATLTAAWKASTNYYVRVGGDGSIERYTLTVNTTKTLPEAPSTEPDVPVVPTVDKWGIGNVDLSGEAYQEDLETAVSYVDVSDAILLLYYLDGDESKFTNEEVLENINRLGDIDGNITDYENEYPDVTDVIGLLQFIEGEANDRNMPMVNYYYPDGV